VAMAVGSITGALTTGARGIVSERLLVGAAGAFGIFALLAAAAPTLPLALLALVPLGAVSVTFAAGVNSTLQLGASPPMRGRVMALYSVVFLGSTPIGGPFVGWLSEVAGPRAGLVLAGVAALAAALGGRYAFARSRGEPALTGNALRGLRRWRLRGRRAVAIQARGADQPDGLERRRGLDVEPNPVAILDRGDRSLAAAAEQRRDDREAGADRSDLRPDEARAAGCQGEGPERPQPPECDPCRALDRQGGRGARTREHARDRLRRARRAAEQGAGRRGEDPPAEGDGDRELVGVAIGDDDRDRAERGRDGGGEQGAAPKQVAERHQSPRSSSRKP